MRPNYASWVHYGPVFYLGHHSDVHPYATQKTQKG